MGGSNGPHEPDQTTLLKAFSAIESGLRQGSSSPYSTPETRVYLDLTRLISFYDTDTFPSLVEGRARITSEPAQGNRREKSASPFRQGLFDTQLVRGRWRVGPIGGISREDRDRLIERLDEVLQAGRHAHTDRDEVDWVSLFRQVKDYYAERLEILHYILSETSTSDAHILHQTLLNARMYLENILTPYILYGVRPLTSSSSANSFSLSDERRYTWATPILEQCSKHFVPPLSSGMTSSERLLISGLRGTKREICRVLVKMWAIGAESGNAMQTSSSLNTSQLRELHKIYVQDLTGLTSWLDWSTPWIRCISNSSSSISTDGCSFDEICYLPTWPFFHNLEPAIPGLPPRRWPDEGTSEWTFPQPRCIRRLFPLHLP